MTARRQLSVEDWFGILRRRAWLLVIPALLCAAGGVLVSLALPKQYTSHTRVLVESPIVPDDYVKPVVSDDLNRRLASMQGEILSRTHLQELITKFHLYQEDGSGAPMEMLVDRLRKSINVAPLPPTPGTNSQAVLGFNVDVTLTQPKLAQDVCTEIASMFMDQNLRLREQQAEDTTQFLGKQLNDAKQKLDEQDAKLATFQNQYLGAQPEDQQTNLTVLAGLTPQLEAVTQSLNEAQENKAFSESMLSQQLNGLKSSGGSSPESQEQQLNQLQAQLSALRARYTDRHPEVLKLQAEVADLQKRMQNPPPVSTAPAKPSGPEPLEVQQLRAQVHQADLAISEKRQEQAQLQQQIKTLQGRIQLSPMVQAQYKSLTRDYQTALGFYNDLLKKRDDAQMATELELRQEGENFRVLDPPSFPERPSFPNGRLFALGGLAVGLALGAGLIKLAELRDKSLRGVRDVEALLGVPTLAVITSGNLARPVRMTGLPFFRTGSTESRGLSAR